MYILNDEQQELRELDLKLAIDYFEKQRIHRLKMAEQFRYLSPAKCRKLEHDADIADRAKKRIQNQA